MSTIFLEPFMRPYRMTQLALSAFAAALFVTACGPGDVVVPTMPSAAPSTVNVSVSTGGFHFDSDGYVVTLGAEERTIAVNDTAQFASVAPGSYTVSLTGLAGNCSVSGTESLTAVVTEGGTTSLAFEVQCRYDLSGSVLSQLVCSGMAPGATQGLPGDLVPLGTLPAGLQAPLFARVSWTGNEDVVLAFVDPDAGTMSVPLHPSGSMSGGEVEVRISDAVSSCAPFSFTINALTAAPGEYTAIVDLMQDLIEAQAALVGLTVQDLIEADLASLPLYLLPLAVSQSMVDHPGNLNSMRAIVAGTAPDLQGLDMDLFDALLALTGLRSDMEASLITTREATDLFDVPTAAPQRAPLLNGLDCMFGGIDDAESLDRCMTLGRDKIPGPAGTSARQLLSNYLTAAATVPVLKPLMSAASELLWAMGTYDDILASNLPTEFVSITVQHDSVFDEDEEGPGTWAPATVMATSAGWRFDRLFFDALVRSVQATPTYGAWMAGAGGTTAESLAAANLVQGESWDEVFAEMISAVITTAFSWMFNQTGGVNPLEIPPRTFGPIDISSETFSVSRIVFGDAVERVSHEEYEPRMSGISQLEVITAQGKFGGTNIATNPFPRVEVRRIDLEFEPFLDFLAPVENVFVAPGDTVDLFVTVQNSAFPDSVELLELAPAKGSATLTLGDGEAADGRTWHQVRYIAPLDLTGLPAVLAARHTTTTGARQYGTEERVAYVTFRPEVIQISPSTACVEPGDTLQFEATISGESGRDILWSADVGSIGRNSGLYTAPASADPGTLAVITATSAEDQNQEAEVSISIGCSCYSTITVGGVTVTAQAGESVSFGDWGGPDQPYANNFEFYSVLFSRAGDGSTYTLPLDANPATWPTVGSNAVRVQGSVGISSPQIIYSSDDEDPAILNLQEYVPEKRAVGSVRATVAILSSQPPYSEIVTFNWRFAITVPPGYQRGGPTSHGYRFACTVAGG